MCARFASYWESGTLVTLEPVYARAGARSLRSRVPLLTPGFCCFCFWNAEGYVFGDGVNVGLEVGEETEKRSGSGISYEFLYSNFIIRNSCNVMYL